MNKLSAESIANMVRCCVGHLDTNGDKEYDSTSLKNTAIFLKVIEKLLEDVYGLTDEVNSDIVPEMLISCRAVGFIAETRDKTDGWLHDSMMKMFNGN